MTITIRPARIDDVKAVARIQLEGWRASYQYIVDQDYLDNLSVEEKEKNWARWFGEGEMQTVIAETENGEAVGFASFGKLRTAIPGMSPIRPLYSAELYAIYILPDYWQQGIGKALIAESCKMLKDMKHKSLALWVLDKNKRAQAVYKALGGQRCGKRMTEIAGKELKEVCYGWRDTSVLYAAS